MLGKRLSNPGVERIGVLTDQELVCAFHFLNQVVCRIGEQRSRVEHELKSHYLVNNIEHWIPEK